MICRMNISVVTGQGNKREYNIQSNFIRIGRDPTNEIVIQDSKVSRNHAVILMENGIYNVKDIGSVNGTYLNGNKLTSGKIYSISGNSTIRVGDSMISLSIDAGNAELIKSGNRIPATVISNTPQNVSKPPLYNQNLQKGNQWQGMGQEMEYALRAQKSYAGSAWLTFFLYFIGLYIGGIIANFLFLSDAKRTAEVIGREPAGMTCLNILIWVMFYIPMILGFIALIVMLVTGAGIFSSF